MAKVEAEASTVPPGLTARACSARTGAVWRRPASGPGPVVGVGVGRTGGPTIGEPIAKRMRDRWLRLTSRHRSAGSSSVRVRWSGR